MACQKQLNFFDDALANRENWAIRCKLKLGLRKVNVVTDLKFNDVSVRRLGQVSIRNSPRKRSKSWTFYRVCEVSS